ncbi:hypothetical protein GYMLUDRAFT_246140 [Collybiopsis luxurians FD-317 M1]|uniref:Uncharacterized protein n=1 Tax=Collybiopsis luxurians FD-317 M1 TaxID=944289 RepID=A0A0D0CJC2_9AGAR|nr:hypothetical protein GYMLUDRAFT_246140 [Collybiopsis luxurians FD-317 M1]
MSTLNKCITQAQQKQNTIKNAQTQGGKKQVHSRTPVPIRTEALATRRMPFKGKHIIMDFIAMLPVAPTASPPPNPEHFVTLKSKSIQSQDNTPGVALDDSYVQDPIPTQTVSMESDSKDKLELNVQDLTPILEVENTQEEGHDFNSQSDAGIVEDKGGHGKMDPVVVEDSAFCPPWSRLPGPPFNEAQWPLEDLPPPTSLVDRGVLELTTAIKLSQELPINHPLLPPAPVSVSFVSKTSKAGQSTLTVVSPSLKKQDDFGVTKPSSPTTFNTGSPHDWAAMVSPTGNLQSLEVGEPGYNKDIVNHGLYSQMWEIRTKAWSCHPQMINALMTHFNDQYWLLPLQADSTEKDFHRREDFWVFIIDNLYGKYISPPQTPTVPAVDEPNFDDKQEDHNSSPPSMKMSQFGFGVEGTVYPQLLSNDNVDVQGGEADNEEEEELEETDDVNVEQGGEPEAEWRGIELEVDEGAIVQSKCDATTENGVPKAITDVEEEEEDSDDNDEDLENAPGPFKREWFESASCQLWHYDTHAGHSNNKSWLQTAFKDILILSLKEVCPNASVKQLRWNAGFADMCTDHKVCLVGWPQHLKVPGALGTRGLGQILQILVPVLKALVKCQITAWKKEQTNLSTQTLPLYQDNSDISDNDIEEGDNDGRELVRFESWDDKQKAFVLKDQGHIPIMRVAQEGNEEISKPLCLVHQSQEYQMQLTNCAILDDDKELEPRRVKKKRMHETEEVEDDETAVQTSCLKKAKKSRAPIGEVSNNASASCEVSSSWHSLSSASVQVQSTAGDECKVVHKSFTHHDDGSSMDQCSGPAVEWRSQKDMDESKG